MAKVSITVFGGVNPGSGSCRAGLGECSPASTGHREYEVMREILLDVCGETEVDLEFIDTGGGDLGVFPLVEQAFRAGHLFPMAVIDGEVRWSGSIPLGAIIELIQAQS